MSRRLLVMALPLFLTACAGDRVHARPDVQSTEEGQATWYGERHQGKRTANGERFDLNKLTAAHRTLPFGTRVRVVHLRTGKSVVVRINDRKGKGGLIDLSKAAAKRIGLVKEGRTQVRLEVLGR